MTRPAWGSSALIGLTAFLSMVWRCSISFLALQTMPADRAAAQQREPALEAYVLTGGFFHGNLSVAAVWKPQLGGGVLVPVGSRWAGLLDVTTSAAQAYWKHDGGPGATQEDNFSRQRRVALLPSFVRLWRRERFSVYAGGGIAFEHERQRSRFRPIIARDDLGRPVLTPDYMDERSNGRTPSWSCAWAPALA